MTLLVRSVLALGCLCAAVCARDARAGALTAEQAISQAITKVEGAEFEQALDLLRAAEQLTGDRAVLARIYLERGVVHEILKRPDEAIASFFRAVRCDAGTTLSADAHKASAVKLFAIAKALAAADPDAKTLGDQQAGFALGPDRKACAAVPAAATAPVVETAGVDHSVATPAWIATGVTVVAAGIGAAFAAAASSKDSECQSIVDPAAYAVCDGEATDRERNASLVLGVAAGAAVITATLWIYEALE